MNNLARMWASLGVTFFAESTEIPTSPEEGIIAFVRSGEFPKDKTMMPLVLGWLKEYSRLVHVERLRNLSDDLSDFEMAVLGVLAKKCVGQKDLRWGTIVKKAKEKIDGKKFVDGDSDTFLAVKGSDPDFAEFGLKMAPMNIENVEKKLRPRNFLVKNNVWIKNRILFGANVRADIATIRELRLAETAYRASQIAACSTKAAYNSWADLEEVNWFKKSPA